VQGWSAEEWAALASWLTFGVLLVSLVFAARQVLEAVRLREAQTRPFVVVDFDVEGILLNLTIENTGSLAAREVRLVFEPPMQSAHDDPWPPEESTLISRGIPTIPPGKRFSFFLDSIPYRIEQELPMTYTARVSYRADGRKRPFEDAYTLDLSFLLGLGEIHRNSLHDVAQTLEEIQKDVRRWTEDMNGIRVYVLDYETHRRESAMGMAWQGVAGQMRGGDPEKIRTALREALGNIGENVEPPQSWVDAIAQGKPVYIRLQDTYSDDHPP
jgi:hypothetical protein